MGEANMTICATPTTKIERAALGTPLFRSETLAARNLRVVGLEHTLDEPSSADRAKTNSPARIHGDSIAFGDFRILPGERLLLKNGSPVHVGARAFDVLVILAERPGQVVSRQEIEARAYPGLRVSEGALRFQIGVLRKALGEGRGRSHYIANVNGRGYCFAAPVIQSEANEPVVANSNNARRSNLSQEMDIHIATRSIRAAIENRSESRGVASEIAPTEHSDGPITVVFFLLGRRATLVLDNPPSVDGRAV
jgi:DNA-binding winged helix-turn-helix (wHTH) protein